jgi:hypothetical protein
MVAQLSASPASHARWNAAMARPRSRSTPRPWYAIAPTMRQPRGSPVAHADSPRVRARARRERAAVSSRDASSPTSMRLPAR